MVGIKDSAKGQIKAFEAERTDKAKPVGFVGDFAPKSAQHFTDSARARGVWIAPAQNGQELGLRVRQWLSVRHRSG